MCAYKLTIILAVTRLPIGDEEVAPQAPDCDDKEVKFVISNRAKTLKVAHNQVSCFCL